MRERVFSRNFENVSGESNGRDIGCVMREQRPALDGPNLCPKSLYAKDLILIVYCISI